MKGDYEDDYDKKFGRLLAKAWLDDAFKDELLRDPKSALRNNGIDVPDGVEVKVAEVSSNEVSSLADLPLATPDRFVLALPSKPSSAFMSDEELGRVVGGDARLPRPKCHLSHPCIF